MQIIKNLVSRIYHFKHYFILGLLMITMFTFVQQKFAFSETNVLKAETIFSEKKADEYIPPLPKDQMSLIAEFFGEEISETDANSIVKEKEDFITTRPAYGASLEVIQRHEDTIREKAEEYGVPADVAIGVGFLENGGSETAKSRSGALGIFQLMPSTARNLGLTVNRKVDQRRDPVKNIDAGMRYLSSNYNRFGDWGLATWAYHAGEGNVAKAVKLYFKEQYNVKLAGLNNIDQMKNYIDNNDTTVYDILSSPSVKNFTKKLNDDSSSYPYKVLATAKLFKQSLASGI